MLTTSCAQRCIQLRLNLFSALQELHLTQARIYFRLLTDSSEDRIPVGARFSALVQTGPEAHPASCTMGTGSFPRVRCGRGVTLTPHPLLVPRSKTE